MDKLRLVIIGAGNRGTTYAHLAARELGRAQIVGVTEPRAEHRERLAQAYDIPPQNVMSDWREAAARERFADAVVISTMDPLHEEPAIAFAEKGYGILLEKPLALSEAGCRRVARAVRERGVIFAICHVLRYTAYTQTIKAILESGELGEIAGVQHLEPVNHWHMAHSFVRGNWRREDESSFMLMSKSCHDIDWLQYVMGRRCVSVSSFGSLQHFRPENRPPGAGERCLDCAVEADCPYSAKQFYLGRVAGGQTGWPVDVLTPDPTAESVREALRTGPYGRCVYACDNDVVDSQVVNMLFEGGKTCSFTMTAFSNYSNRQTRIFGTHGELSGDGSIVTVRNFLTGETRRIDTSATDGSILGGHGGGDEGLMRAFLDAMESGDPACLLSGIDETLFSYKVIFAAERARREKCVVDLSAD